MKNMDRLRGRLEYRMANQRERGQSLTEFSLTIVILMVVVAGLLDLGRAFHSIIVITNAAREGARYLTQHPDDIIGTEDAAIAEAEGSFINLTVDNVDYTCITLDTETGCDSGQPATVTVNYQFDFILGWLFPSQMSFSRSAEMMVE